MEGNTRLSIIFTKLSLEFFSRTLWFSCQTTDVRIILILVMNINVTECYLKYCDLFTIKLFFVFSE